MPAGKGSLGVPLRSLWRGAFSRAVGSPDRWRRKLESRAEKYRVEEPLCRGQPFAGLLFGVGEEDGINVNCLGDHRFKLFL